MAQVMLAFQRANPDAFNDGNINNMKVGAVLRVPSADDLNAIGQQEAYAEVLVQNGLWDEYVTRVTGVSPAVASETGGADMTTQEDTSEAGGELSLLLPGEGESESSGIGDTGDVDGLRTRLAIAEEELDASRIENQELESRIAELQARLSKVEELQKMVEIEDDSLAQMQAEQAEAMEQAQEQAATDSVTDGWGRVHDVPWLYVADSSLFPQCSEVNPYVTVMALADRVAEGIRNNAGELLS